MTKSAVYPNLAAFKAAEGKKWRWPSFKPSEVACKDGSIMIDTAALDCMQALRDRIGRPLVLTSAYRSPRYNQRVGGAPRSRHMLAEAFDIVLAGHDPHEVEALAREVGFHGIGRYPEKGFIHCDIRPAAQAATWGPEWPFGEDDDLAPPPPALPGILGAVPAAVEATKAAAQAKFANAAKAKARAACE